MIMVAIGVAVIGSVLFSWWQMLYRRGAWSARVSASAVAAVTNVELVAREPIIPGALSVEIHIHRLDSVEGPVPCWTYVSQGLWPLGQKEIVFTVKRRSNEAEGAYPRDLLTFYRIVHQLAAQGQRVDIGGVTTLRGEGQGFLGRKDFVGILYAPPQAFGGIRIAVPS